jgi:hypothetical protein
VANTIKKKKQKKPKTPIISDYSKIEEHKASIQNSIAFLYTSNEQLEFETKKHIVIEKERKNKLHTQE